MHKVSHIWRGSLKSSMARLFRMRVSATKKSLMQQTHGVNILTGLPRILDRIRSRSIDGSSPPKLRINKVFSCFVGDSITRNEKIALGAKGHPFCHQLVMTAIGPVLPRRSSIKRRIEEQRLRDQWNADQHDFLQLIDLLTHHRIPSSCTPTAPRFSA